VCKLASHLEHGARSFGLVGYSVAVKGDNLISYVPTYAAWLWYIVDDGSPAHGKNQTPLKKHEGRKAANIVMYITRLPSTYQPRYWYLPQMEIHQPVSPMPFPCLAPPQPSKSGNWPITREGGRPTGREVDLLGKSLFFERLPYDPAYRRVLSISCRTDAWNPSCVDALVLESP
jgi:hypothetical protein